MTANPRPYTEQEVLDQMLGHIAHMITYWMHETKISEKGRMQGLVFSFLTMLDGQSRLPVFDLALNPHQDDAEFYKNRGENWHEPLLISCMLHEEWAKKWMRD